MISCPCNRFDTIESIREALDSDDSIHIHQLQAWLSGRFHQRAASSTCSSSTGEGRKRLECGSTCRNRVKISFAVLNGIRDACRPFLESSSCGLGSASAQLQATPRKNEPSYDEAFPSLGPGPGRQNAASKPKRRIRPALVTQPKTAVAPAWNLVNVSSDDDPSFPALGRRAVPLRHVPHGLQRLAHRARL